MPIHAPGADLGQRVMAEPLATSSFLPKSAVLRGYMVQQYLILLYATTSTLSFQIRL